MLDDSVTRRMGPCDALASGGHRLSKTTARGGYACLPVRRMAGNVRTHRRDEDDDLEWPSSETVGPADRSLWTVLAHRSGTRVRLPAYRSRVNDASPPVSKADGPLRAKARRERRELVVMVRWRQRCQASERAMRTKDGEDLAAEMSR